MGTTEDVAGVIPLVIVAGVAGHMMDDRRRTRVVYVKAAKKKKHTKHKKRRKPKSHKLFDVS
jgi:hypothetical protein